MQSKKLAGPRAGVPSQKFLDIAEIREDTVILKDGSLRGVLLVSSINFALKSVDEQNAIVQAYMQFLNGLDFPIQIVIQSRRMNIDAYLNDLKEHEKNLANELLKHQIQNYREYIKQLISLGEIMQKRFFIVVPWSPLADKQKNFFQRLTDILSPQATVRLSEERFQKQKFSLNLRLSSIVSGLSSMSLQAAQLDTQSLIELYYTVYNPELFQTEKMANMADLQLEG